MLGAELGSMLRGNVEMETAAFDTAQSCGHKIGDKNVAPQRIKMAAILKRLVREALNDFQNRHRPMCFPDKRSS